MSTATKVKRKPGTRPGTSAILPIDLALLALLPDEGQMMGFTPIALQIRAIKRSPGFEDISGNQIGGRLKSMAFQGYTCSQVTLPIQAGLGWQRTAKGRELLGRNGKETA